MTKRNVDASFPFVFISSNDYQKKETSRLTPLAKTSQNLPSKKVEDLSLSKCSSR